MRSISDTTRASRAIRLPEVCNLTGMSVATIWRKCRATSDYFDPHFPKPFHVSEAVTVWDEGEIVAWVASKKSNVVQFKRKVGM